jgi:hypothetical protein
MAGLSEEKMRTWKILAQYKSMARNHRLLFRLKYTAETLIIQEKIATYKALLEVGSTGGDKYYVQSGPQRNLVGL